MKTRVKPRLFVAASQRGITEIGLGRKRSRDGSGASEQNGGARGRRWGAAGRRELEAYFTGRSRSFSTPCDLAHLPRFTRAVLRITARIPYGEVRSYRWVARALGKPKAMRAVGNALARNPVPIMIPCHRVVRSDGSLGGYALGRNWKKRLLDLERTGLAIRRRKRRK